MEPPYPIGPPRWFIDRASGLVWLRLVPYTESRTLPDPRVDGPRIANLPFPLRSDTAAIDLYLRIGMSKSEIRLDDEVLWRSYALVPFGWLLFVQPELRFGRLTALTLTPHRYPGSLDAFARVLDWITSELGPPDRRRGHPPYVRRREAPELGKSLPGSAEWRPSWGSVTLSFDPREHEPVLRIRWKRAISWPDIGKTG